MSGSVSYSASSSGLRLTSSREGILYAQDGDVVGQLMEMILRIASTSADIAAALADGSTNYMGVTGWASRNLTVTKRPSTGGTNGTTFVGYKTLATGDRTKHDIWEISAGVWQYSPSRTKSRRSRPFLRLPM